MGYEFTCSIPMVIGAALAIVFGLFITLVRLQDWAAKLINKNRRVVVVDYKTGKQSKYHFSTVKQAAAFALKRKGGVAYIEADGKTVWHSGNDKQSLVNLAEE